MAAVLVRIELRRIIDWNSFHDVFAAEFGFPAFYGRNMNAWIDCMSDLSPGTGMSSVHAPPGGVVTLELMNVREFRQRDRELYDAIVESAAFVNWRKIQAGESPVLALAFWE
jgi:RNAse (barnase) inhibitor barstar